MKFAIGLSPCILAVALSACGSDEEGEPGRAEQALVPAGMPPVNTVPAGQAINEDTPLIFGQASNLFGVADADSTVVTSHVVVTNGVFSVGASTAIVTGSGTTSVTITGTPTAVTNALNAGTYTPEPNFVGSAQLSLNTSDSDGNVDVDPVAITVSGVNDPPVNIAPTGAQAGTEDVPRTFSNISIQDIDVAGSTMAMTLDATNGATITLAGMGGLVFTGSDGTADAHMEFTGTLPNINSALNGMTVTPPPNFIGTTQLSMTSNDQGASGSGGVGSDTDTFNIDWAAVNDAPTNTVPPAQETDQGTARVFSTANCY